MSEGDVSVIFIKDSRQDFSADPSKYEPVIEVSIMLPSEGWAKLLNMIVPGVEPCECVITVHDTRA